MQVSSHHLFDDENVRVHFMEETLHFYVKQAIVGGKLVEFYLFVAWTLRSYVHITLALTLSVFLN